MAGLYALNKMFISMQKRIFDEFCLCLKGGASTLPMILTLHRGETKSQLPLKAHPKFRNNQVRYYSSSATKEDVREETADTTAEETHNIIKNEEKVKGIDAST